MKQRSDGVGFRVDSRKVRTFVQVAVVACKREISRFISSTMLSWNNMFDVKAKEKIVSLVYHAILASICCAIPNQVGKRLIDHA